MFVVQTVIMGLGRLLDIVFFFYFFTHIPITVLVDSQAVIPWKSIYPDALQDTLAWYTREFRDPMMVDPPPWFKSFCICEVFLQFPFFFVGVYVFWNGYKNNTWSRIPMIVYSSHVATTVIAILYHILEYDFSKGAHPGPRNMSERMTLISIYCPYLIIPLLILIRMLFGDEHLRKQKVK